MHIKYFYNYLYICSSCWNGTKKERVRIPTINMFYYTYISYDDYTILIHSFNCPAIKQGIFIFLSSSSHHRYIILLLLDIVTHISLNHNTIFYIHKNIGSPLLTCLWIIIYFRVLFPYFLNLWQTIKIAIYRRHQFQLLLLK